jgi:hypothetical protein
MKRKTIEVEEIKRRANDYFRNSTVSAEARLSVQVFVTSILQDTGNYHGMNYIYWNDKGFDEWVEAGKPEDYPTKYKYFGDQSRIFYY